MGPVSIMNVNKLCCWIKILEKAQILSNLGLKVRLWKRFGEARSSLGGAPEGSWRRFWGSWEVLGGLLVSEYRFINKCEVLDPKLGSMLGQKNVFFDVENWKNGVPRGVAKKV